MPLLTKEQYLRSLTPPEAQCSICREHYGSGHEPVRIGTCGHWFCRPCLMSAAETSPSPDACPVCRAPVFDIPEQVFFDQPGPMQEIQVTIRNLPDDMVPLNRQDNVELFRSRWNSVNEMSPHDIVNVVGRIWDLVRPNALSRLALTDEQLAPQGDLLLVDGIMMHILDHFDPRVGENDRYSSVRTYLAYVILHRHAYPPNLRKEPVRSLVDLMMTYSGMKHTFTLRPESSLLWWKVNILLCKHEGTNTQLSEQEKFDAIHFLFMVENSVLCIPEDLIPRNWHLEWEHRFWEKFENRLDLHLGRRKQLIRTAVQRLQEELNFARHQPVFIGASAEKTMVKELWQRIQEEPV